MNRKEAKREIDRMLAEGRRKGEVFDALQGQGVKDRRLAYLIASHVDPRRVERNRVHVRIVVAIMALQLVLGLLMAFYVGVVLESLAGGLVIGVVVTAIMAAFIHGFLRNSASAYTVYAALTGVQLARGLRGFETEPGTTAISFMVAIALVAYLLFVQQRLFPDLRPFGMRKQAGRYVFVDD